ncbi:MAG: biotin--[acetyl-CoA-carboxylase] ligase [Bacteroidia bacterium]
MNTLFIGKNFVELSEVDSTNTVAQSLLEAGAAEGTVVLAQHQTAGRGQQGSQWLAQPGQNLTFSLVLQPHFLAPRQIFLLNKLIACALRELVAGILPESTVQIKWPNDLLVNRRKVAGILVETALEPARIKSAVVGIGLNVNQWEFDPELHGRATSLVLESGKEHTIRPILERLLELIEAGYLAIRAGRADRIEREYLQHLFAYQEDTEVEIAGQRISAHVVGVDPDGRLALRHGEGLHFYGVKEVRFIL